jgi:hypothetical protein
MRVRSFLLVSLLLSIPAAALAGAPFATPPQPDVPLGPPAIDGRPDSTPPVAAPPFDFDLPSHDLFDLPELPEQAQGSRPDPLPSADAGIPDLIGVVDLPEGALDHVIDQAPPFGGEHGNRFVTAVPEPTTGVLVAFGLLAIAVRKRASV